jgi:hypothetical protein
MSFPRTLLRKYLQMTSLFDRLFPKPPEQVVNIVHNDNPIHLDALDHIVRVCKASRTQTRRIRWIERRAEGAIRGEESDGSEFDLPKKPSEETFEKLKRQLAHAKRLLAAHNIPWETNPKEVENESCTEARL